jgi:hypothetical protein
MVPPCRIPAPPSNPNPNTTRTRAQGVGLTPPEPTRRTSREVFRKMRRRRCESSTESTAPLRKPKRVWDCSGDVVRAMREKRARNYISALPTQAHAGGGRIPWRAGVEYTVESQGGACAQYRQSAQPQSLQTDVPEKPETSAKLRRERWPQGERAARWRPQGSLTCRAPEEEDLRDPCGVSVAASKRR